MICSWYFLTFHTLNSWIVTATTTSFARYISYQKLLSMGVMRVQSGFYMPAMMSILILFLINLSAVPYCIWIHSLWIVRTRKRARLVILTSSDLPSPYIKGDLWLVAKELIMWLRCKKNVTSYSPSHAKRKRLSWGSMELPLYKVTISQHIQWNFHQNLIQRDSESVLVGEFIHMLEGLQR